MLKTDLRLEIVQKYEDWALYADSYSFEYELGQIPPKEYLIQEITDTITKIQSLSAQLKININQLKTFDK